MKGFLIIFLTLLCAISFASQLTLVSDNTINFPGGSGIFPANTPHINTGAEISLITNGEFATDPETVLNFENSKTVTTKGISNGKSCFTDGSCLSMFNIPGHISDQSWSKWNDGKYVTVLFDLKKIYPVVKVDVFAYTSSQCSTSKFDVYVSANGKDWYSRGSFLNNDDKEAIKWSTISAYISPATEARYIKLVIAKEDGRFQQQIGEIAVWADLDKNVKTVEPSKPESVKFKLSNLGFGAIYVDWNNFAIEKSATNKINKWNIYISDKEFSDVKKDNVKLHSTAKGDTTSLGIYPVNPGKTYYVGVTAQYNNKEYTEVVSEKITMPKTYEAKTFQEMLAINHFPYGGGFQQNRKTQKEWGIVAFDLLQTIPFKEQRWWLLPEDWTKEAYNRGIGRLLTILPGDKRIKKAEELGIMALEIDNEPDFNNVSPELYASRLKVMHKEIKKINPDFIITGPTVGTEDNSLKWIDDMYKAGAKDYFDVLDSHPYTKVEGGHKVPFGVPAGAPESLIYDIEKLKSIMAKYGDENKPIICSEFGYSDVPYNNPSGKLNRKTQAEYLSRGLVLLNMLGIKRVYIYSFFDAGTDPVNQEHHFGLMDWYLQKKPAFYAVQTLANQIGNYSYKEEVKNATSPVFGYIYEKDNKYISVIWNADKTTKIEFETKDTEVEIVNLYGDKDFKIKTDNNKFSTEIGNDLIFIHHENPLIISK